MSSDETRRDDSHTHMGGAIPGSRKAAFSLSLPGGGHIPVLLSVPHAGRFYPGSLQAMMRRPEWDALRLEDRFVDLIARKVAHHTHAGLLIADAPRAMIDLNRSVDDVDWSMVKRGGQMPLPEALKEKEPRQRNRRVESGLGLIPRRLHGFGEIWRHPIEYSSLNARIHKIHTPYHQALHNALASIRDHWGAALLVDVHSMPPLNIALEPSAKVRSPVDFVIGDRFGASANMHVVDTALGAISKEQMIVTRNRPYAGSYVLDRHGDPKNGIHAIQLEISRNLYLDDAMDQPVFSHVDNLADLVSKVVLQLTKTVVRLGSGRNSALAAE